MNDLHQLINRLKKHNSWRRGELELTKEELDPTQIGLDIDEAIYYLEAIFYEEIYPNFEKKKNDTLFLAKKHDKSVPDKSIKPPEFISVNEGYFK
jgi:hypothetical protein